MRYYKNGNSIIATVGNLELPELTAEEYEAEQVKAAERAAKQAEEFSAVPTIEERLEAIEQAILELILGGVI